MGRQNSGVMMRMTLGRTAARHFCVKSGMESMLWDRKTWKSCQNHQKKGEEILVRLGRMEHKKLWHVMFSGLQELQNVSYPTKNKCV